jgi:hypothetical protein
MPDMLVSTKATGATGIQPLLNRFKPRSGDRAEAIPTAKLITMLAKALAISNPVMERSHSRAGFRAISRGGSREGATFVSSGGGGWGGV